MSDASLLESLAEVLRERRLALGLTQEDVGDLHRNYVGGVERGEINPTVTQLARIADGLNSTAWELLREAQLRPDLDTEESPRAGT